MIGRRTFNRLLALTPFGLSACGSRDESVPATPAASSSSPPPPDPSRAIVATQPTTARAGGAFRLLALGDSYTIGESVAVHERWPVQLAARLREAGLDVADPEIIAHTGWRTDDLDRAITRTNPRGPYDLVGLLIGVNNQYQGLNAEQYKPEFQALLKRAIGFAGDAPSRVIVLSIPDWGATPFGGRTISGPSSKMIDAFNAVNRAEAAKAGVAYVDVTPVSRQALKQPDLVAEDGLHPSATMYAEWVKLTLPAAKAALTR